MHTVVVRVWLPDRPGALGQVASRIGAVRGDVLGIEILESGGGSAVDELVVALPDEQLVDLLVAEVSAVDGVAVEDVRPIEGDRADAGPDGAVVGAPSSPKPIRPSGWLSCARLSPASPTPSGRPSCRDGVGRALVRTIRRS